MHFKFFIVFDLIIKSLKKSLLWFKQFCWIISSHFTDGVRNSVVGVEFIMRVLASDAVDEVVSPVTVIHGRMVGCLVAGVVSPVSEVLFGVVHSVEVVVVSHLIVVCVLLVVERCWVVTVVRVVSPVGPVLRFLTCFVSVMDGRVSVEVGLSPDGVF